jgi:tetratricopeptide (TPR) repeat protein
MNGKKNPILLLVLAGLLASAAGRAYAAFEDLGAGARAAGMGDAFVAVADDVYAIYYNPAGLGTLERPEFGAGYNKLHAGLSDGSNIGTSFLGYVHPLQEGAKGTLGAAWNSFSVDSTLYREDSIYMTYGREIWSPSSQNKLYGGLSLKYLRSSFGTFPESADSTNGIVVQTGQADPVLTGSSSKGMIDADLGLLLKMNPHYSLGMAVTHLLAPDAAFADGDSDKLPMAIKLAGNYRSHLSNLTAQVDMQKAPDGTQDKTFSMGAERWFVSRFYGTLGARGGFNFGSRDYKNLNLGFSYKTRRMRFDYGFALPIGTVSGTAGSHKFAMSVKFGKRTDDEESLQLLLEAMRELRSKKPAAFEPRVDGLSTLQKAAYEEYMAQSRSMRSKGLYKEALEQMSRAMAIAPASRELLSLYSRLNSVVQFYPSLANYHVDAVEAALYRGIRAYLASRDIEAVERVSYAHANSPEDSSIEKLLAHFELSTGFKRVTTSAKSKKSMLIETLLTKAETALENNDFRKAIELSLSVLREDEGKAGAWQNLGAAYFALRDYDSSLRAWGRVLDLERSPAAQEAIRGYISTITRLKNKQDGARRKGLERRERRRQRRLRDLRNAAPKLPERPKLTSREVEALFDDGVKQYTRRDYEAAAKSFETILEALPNHEEAHKALMRVKEHLR